MSQTNLDGYTLEEWVAEADKHVQATAGVSIHDLADGPSWDAWNYGIDPGDYAAEQLEEEGFPFS